MQTNNVPKELMDTEPLENVESIEKIGIDSIDAKESSSNDMENGSKLDEQPVNGCQDFGKEKFIENNDDIVNPSVQPETDDLSSLITNDSNPIESNKQNITAICNGNLDKDSHLDNNTADNEINFDQIFDNLNANGGDGLKDYQPDSMDESISKDLVPPQSISKNEENQSNLPVELEISNGDTETAKKSNSSFEIGAEDEEMLLKSPSMCEKYDNQPVYSESVLLNDTEVRKKSTEIIDNNDDGNDDDVKFTESTEDTDDHQQIVQSEVKSNIELSKSAECSKLPLNESNDLENDNSVGATEKMTARNEELKSNEENDSLTVPMKSPQENLDTSVENQHENMLEEMSGSPNSDMNCREQSLSSVRDDPSVNDDDFPETVADLKDENSTDARDGFDDTTTVEEAQKCDDQSIIDIDKPESNEIAKDTNVSNISNGGSSMAFDSVDISDSFESKSDNGNDQTSNDANKSSESVIAIDDDDGSAEPEIPNGQTDNDSKYEEPPSKRMRISESGESIDMSNKIDDEKVPDVVIEPTEIMPEDNKTDQPMATDDDDDIVIIESNETKIDDINAVSNKRPASPLEIDTENDKKKPKPDTSETTDNETNDSKLDVKNIEKIAEELNKPIDTEKTNKLKPNVDIPEIESDVVDDSEQMIDTKVNLEPKPEKVEKRSIALDFAAKFKKNLTQMSRKNLEEFVLGKIIEAIVHKSEYSDLKRKTEAQEVIIQASRIKLQEISKQYRDLEMVYARLRKDLENRNQSTVTPIKINRAVGLQVSLQKGIASKDLPKNTPKPPTVLQARIIQQKPAMVPQQKQLPMTIQRPVAAKRTSYQVQKTPVRQTSIRQLTPEQARAAATGDFAINFSSLK